VLSTDPEIAIRPWGVTATAMTLSVSPVKVFSAMALVKSHSFRVWSDEAEIALSREGVMATAQTSPECLPSVLSSLYGDRPDDTASEALEAILGLPNGRLTYGDRPDDTASEAALTALLHRTGGFLNAVGSHLCLMRKKKRSHTNPPNAETRRFGREIGKEQAPFTP